MFRGLIGATFLIFLSACDDGYGGYGMDGTVYPVGSGAIAPASDSTFSFAFANYDGLDYALWIEWQDDLGNLNQSFLGSLPAAPPGSFAQLSQNWPAISGFPYWVVLTDSSGMFFDSVYLGVPSMGAFLPVSISVIGGALLPS